MEEKVQISFDSTDLAGMIKIMDEHGGSEYPFRGKNQDQEDITISVFKDKIVTITYQSNGWTRKNVYYRDGVSEELFPERWDDQGMSAPQFG